MYVVLQATVALRRPLVGTRVLDPNASHSRGGRPGDGERHVTEFDAVILGRDPSEPLCDQPRDRLDFPVDRSSSNS